MLWGPRSERLRDVFVPRVRPDPELVEPSGGNRRHGVPVVHRRRAGQGCWPAAICAEAPGRAVGTAVSGEEAAMTHVLVVETLTPLSRWLRSAESWVTWDIECDGSEACAYWPRCGRVHLVKAAGRVDGQVEHGYLHRLISVDTYEDEGSAPRTEEVWAIAEGCKLRDASNVDELAEDLGPGRHVVDLEESWEEAPYLFYVAPDYRFGGTW